MQVKRRLVIYVQGYDPRGLAEYYRMFRREYRRTCDLYGLCCRKRSLFLTLLFQLGDLRETVDKGDGEYVGDEDRRHCLEEGHSAANLLHHR